MVQEENFYKTVKLPGFRITVRLCIKTHGLFAFLLSFCLVKVVPVVKVVKVPKRFFTLLSQNCSVCHSPHSPYHRVFGLVGLLGLLGFSERELINVKLFVYMYA